MENEMELDLDLLNTIGFKFENYFEQKEVELTLQELSLNTIFAVKFLLSSGSDLSKKMKDFLFVAETTLSVDELLNIGMFLGRVHFYSEEANEQISTVLH